MRRLVAKWPYRGYLGRELGDELSPERLGERGVKAGVAVWDVQFVLVPQLVVELLAPAAVVVLALLPLGFFVLGVNLAFEHGDGRWPLPALDRVTVAAVALRMVVAPLLLFALSRATIAIPSAYLLQAAMPSAINSLLVGHAYGLDLRVISAAIGPSASHPDTTASVLGGALSETPRWAASPGCSTRVAR